MCKVIGIENVISNFFYANKDKSTVSVSNLNLYKEKIENMFRKKKEFVVIDFTRSSLAGALSRNPDIFEREGSAIRLRNLKKLEENIDFFNSKLIVSDQVRNDYLQFMNSLDDIIMNPKNGTTRRSGR